MDWQTSVPMHSAHDATVTVKFDSAMLIDADEIHLSHVAALI
jgi:hypothetical protein